jgi:hypothetical protein
MPLSDFINAYERNKARPHPRRYKHPMPPVRKVWRDNWHPYRH